MSERTVGIRELKANLSAFLRYVKSGEAIIIEERGKPIGRIEPIETSVADKLAEGIRARHWSWSGRKWRPMAPKAKSRNKKLVSSLLLEDRD